MDDYAYLEDMGRYVGEVGRDITRGGYGSTVRARGRGRGRGGFVKNGHAAGKREIFQQKMAAMDIDVDLLPVGMERRSINQSTWDAR